MASRSTWASTAGSVVVVAIATPLIAGYGWIDGTLRLLAIVWFLTLAIVVPWRPVARNWRRTRSLAVHEWAPLFGNALAGVLYLLGTFVLGEPGPGGALCVTALVLLALTAIVTITSRRRASASA